MDKFGRQYRLIVETGLSAGPPVPLVIEPPFTVEFDITRNVLTSANICSVRIYNLSSAHRKLIRKNINDYGDQRLITFFAGYGTNLPVAFTGNITQAWSVREGTNFITQVECFDGGFAFANGYTDMPFPQGTPKEVIVTTLMANLAQQGVQFGGIGTSIQGATGRGNSYSGSTMELLRQLTGGSAFIDNGKIFVLADNECLPPKGIPIINAAAGLLNTPVLEQSILHFDMIFEPRLIIGQIVFLLSVTEPILSNFYKVISLQHRGMISDAVCGEAITSVGLFAPLAGSTLTVIPGAA